MTTGLFQENSCPEKNEVSSRTGLIQRGTEDSKKQEYSGYQPGENESTVPSKKISNKNL